MNELPRCTPEEAGISSRHVAECISALMHPETTMNGFMAARNGKVFAECWWDPYAPDLVHSNHSFGKSYTATAIGIAAGEGLFSLDDRMTDLFAEEIAERKITPAAGVERITVRHVLTMSNGMTSMSDISGDWIGHYFRSSMSYEPGTRFLYNSAGSCMLGALIEKKTGMSLKDYLADKLFRKIGIDPEHFVWLKFQNGYCAEPGTFATTEDNLRLAMLYVNGGKWNGEQIVPEWFIREALSVQIENPYAPETKDGRCGYGYQLWACSVPGVYRFDGGQGQYGIMWPEKGLVVAIHEGGWCPNGMQDTLDTVYRKLLDWVRDGELPADPEGVQALRLLEREAVLADDEPNRKPVLTELNGVYRTVEGDATPWFAVAPPGRGDFFVEFRDPSEKQAAETYELRLNDERCTLIINGVTEFTANWDGRLVRRFAEHTVFPQLGAYAASARMAEPDTLEMKIHWLNGWFMTTMRFSIDEKKMLKIRSDKLRLIRGTEGLLEEAAAVRAAD